jgi:hypothetical protein
MPIPTAFAAFTFSSLLLTWPLAAQTGAILRPGLTLGDRPRDIASRTWLGLTNSAGSYSLQPVQVALVDTTDDCAGDAILITASQPSAEFLLNVPGLKPGRVRTSTTTPTFIYPGQNTSWQVDPGQWFGVLAYGKAEPIQGNTLFTDYQILVGQGQDLDTLGFPGRFPADGLPTILWVGDLDRDGRPDLIADLTTHYEGHRWALFLSGGWRAPRRIEPVAERVEPGC